MGLLMAVYCATARQQPSSAETTASDARKAALLWASTLRERFLQSSDPVLQVYSEAKLAAIVCTQDKVTGTAEFQEAFRGLRGLPEDAFDQSPSVLASDSFTDLWNTVVPPAKRCNPEVNWFDEGMERRKHLEFRRVNIWLTAALNATNTGRAVQLAHGALEVSIGQAASGAFWWEAKV